MSIKVLSILLVLSVSLAVLSSAALSSEKDQSSPHYYDRNEEGWFWYKTKPEVEDIEDDTPKKQAPVPESSDKRVTSKAIPKYEEITTAWLRKNMQRYLDRAIDHPTEDNLYDYFVLKRIAIKKSEVFSTQGQLVAKKHPELDSDSIYVSNSGTDSVRARLREQSIQESFRKINGKSGLFLFMTPDCKTCDLLLGVARQMNEAYGITYRLVSVGGDIRVKGETVLRDQGQAGKLGIKKYPSIYLANLDGQFEYIASAALTRVEMEKRVVFAAFRLGLVSKKSVMQVFSNPDENVSLPFKGRLTTRILRNPKV